MVVVLTLVYMNIRKFIKFTERLKDARYLETGVYETNAINVPLIAGFVHPKIYLPALLSEDERSYILVHEQVHLRRKDYLTKWGIFLITLIHWFNPLVWVAFYTMSEDMERACDEAVIRIMGRNIKKPYSLSLLSLSASSSGRCFPMVTFSERRIKYRIMNILHYKKPGIILLLLVVTISIATACAVFVESGPEESIVSSKKEGEQETEEKEALQNEDMTDSKIADFFRNFQTAVSQDDRKAVSEMFRYPKELVLPDKEKNHINSPEEFLPFYKEIFTEEFISQIAEIDPEKFTYDEVSGICWGDGLIWAKEYDGMIQMISVFPSRTERYLAYFEGNEGESPEKQENDPMYQVNGIREQEAKDFAEMVIAFAQEDRREELAGVIHYPVELSENDTRIVLESEKDFLNYYDVLMTKEFIQKLSEADTQSMGYRYDGTFLGNGELWMTLIDGELKIISLFPSETIKMVPAGGGEVTTKP